MCYKMLPEQEKKLLLAQMDDIMLHSDRAYKVLLYTLNNERKFCEDRNIPLSNFEVDKFIATNIDVKF